MKTILLLLGSLVLSLHCLPQTSKPKNGFGAVLLGKEAFDKLPKFDFVAYKKSITKVQNLVSTSSVMLIAPPVGNQGGLGSCVSWAVGYTAMGILEYPKYGNDWPTAKRSPAYVYNQVVTTCGSGTTLPSVLNQVLSNGVCSWNLMPYVDTDCTLPNNAQIADGVQNKPLKYTAIVPSSVDDIRAALDLSYPVVIGFTVYQSFNDMWYKDGLWTNSVPYGNNVGAHSICIIGYDDSKQMFKAQNQWGNTNGDGHGYIWIGYNVVTAAQISEAYVLYPDNRTTFISAASCTNSPVKINGNVIGSPGSWNQSSSTIDKVFDNNTNTFFDGPAGNNQWAGLNLGKSQQITCIKFNARENFSSRMNGGKFQVSSDSVFTNPVTIYTIPSGSVTSSQDYYITSINSDGISTQYIRYLAPDNGFGNIAEISVYRNADTSVMSFISATECLSSTTQTSGTGFGTTGTIDRGTGFDKALDGNVNTGFQSNIANNQWVGYDLGSNQNISCIKFRPSEFLENYMLDGKFQISTDAAFTNPVTLYNIPLSPALSFQDYYITSTIAGGVQARYIRYLSPNGGYGVIAEMTVYIIPSNNGFKTAASCAGAATQLSGNIIGSNGSWDGISTRDKAFDGDNNTFFDGSTGNNQWVGLDLGSLQNITCINFSPRSSWASRMIGGRFEVSAEATFNAPTLLYTIPANANIADANNYLTSASTTGVSARFIRFLSPNGGFGNIAEMKVYKSSDGTDKSFVSAAQCSGSTRKLTLKGNSRTIASPGNEYTNALDGINNTYYESVIANGGLITFKMSSIQNITCIAFRPRIGFESRMKGGQIKISNDNTFSNATIIYTIPVNTELSNQDYYITSANPGGVATQYVGYFGADGSYCNIADFSAFTTNGNRVTENVTEPLKDANKFTQSGLQGKQPVIYPNPVHNTLTILQGFENIKSVSFYDMQGRKIFPINIDGLKINISNFATGSYILKLNGSYTYRVEKF